MIILQLFINLVNTLNTEKTQIILISVFEKSLIGKKETLAEIKREEFLVMRIRLKDSQ